MEIILHIGPHKTGTTSVQTAFTKSASALRKRGFLYPKCNWNHPAQHRLAFAMKGGRAPGRGDTPDLEAELAELTQTIASFRGERVLLSSEEFFSCPPAGIQRLQRALSGHEVRLVTFLRRPDNFLISSYNQKIKSSGNGFAFPIRRFLNNPRSIAPELSYATCLERWCDVFGDKALTLSTYEAAPPLDQLREMLDLSDTVPGEPQRLNASVPGVVAEVMRLAKTIGMDPARQKKLFQRALTLFEGEPPFYVPDEDRRAVIAVFEEENTRLFARFGQDNPYTAAAMPSSPQPERLHNIILPDLMRLIDDLI